MFMKKLILGCALLIAVSSLAATRKFQQAGIRAGMTKNEVTSTLASRDSDTRFLLNLCTNPDAHHEYQCRYNGNNGDSVAVFFSADDRVNGFAMTVHFEGPLSASWKLWRDDITKQLGAAPTKVENNPDEYTLKHAEWIVKDGTGKQVEKVRFDAMTGQEIMINYEITP